MANQPKILVIIMKKINNWVHKFDFILDIFFPIHIGSKVYFQVQIYAYTPTNMHLNHLLLVSINKLLAEFLFDILPLFMAEWIEFL